VGIPRIPGTSRTLVLVLHYVIRVVVVGFPTRTPFLPNAHTVLRTGVPHLISPGLIGTDGGFMICVSDSTFDPVGLIDSQHN
jgi:hypothetical protein